ncbi:uncharacterized protein LOC114206519 [Eumetopias jubatus]|uniref:uncharacterized protein LOC114206519 n=1 Tax=Eumetopias jubatus TaxID=34886 RepID=UPI00101602AF|nr:uncharacterized protein LOC114206519 [Eumetopias jubatus]
MHSQGPSPSPAATAAGYKGALGQHEGPRRPGPGICPAGGQAGAARSICEGLSLSRCSPHSRPVPIINPRWFEECPHSALHLDCTPPVKGSETSPQAAASSLIVPLQQCFAQALVHTRMPAMMPVRPCSSPVALLSAGGCRLSSSQPRMQGDRATNRDQVPGVCWDLKSSTLSWTCSVHQSGSPPEPGSLSQLMSPESIAH